MKKIVLFATAFIFSFALMAQNETKTKIKTVPTKVQTRVDTKPTAVAPLTAQTQPVQEGQPSPDDVIKMNTVKHDFGKIPQNTPVTYAFEIKNTSNKPVVVENTSATCGCTVPEKIVEPIAPGATAKLKVQYNAASLGAFTKDVHITLAGIKQPKTVTIVGEVVASEPAKPNN